MSDLFGPIQAAGPVAAATGDIAWLQALLDAEGGLALAQADCGLIPAAHAEAIAAACRAEFYSVAEIGSAATAIGNPAAPLVRALTDRVSDPEAARSVHFGATSQDIMDTAAMLVAERALRALDADVSACAAAVAVLAEDHACTPQVGRSLLQQALPVTFGLTAAGWLAALIAAAERLDAVRARLAVQLGGAVGTLAALGDSGPDVVVAYARRLGLEAPDLPWHTDRTRIADIAGALGLLAGVVGKIGRDITLLAQTEIGEVSEIDAHAGGSSTMPHKRNPIAAVAAVAAGAQAPGLVATLLTASMPELQRGAGTWHAEWRPLRELLRATGASVHWIRISLSRLEIHPISMRRNLARTGGLLMAERITIALSPLVGRLAAQDAVTDSARRATSGAGRFAELLAAHPLVDGRLDSERLEALLEPSTYLGSSRLFVARAVVRHQARIGAQACGTGRQRSVALHSDVAGDAGGVPVLLLNALGSDLSIWDEYVEPLTSKGFRVIRCDARGHGDSPVPAGEYGLADLGADVAALLDRLAVSAAHIVGVSLGGMTGMWLARHRPERVRGLVLCCTSARPGNPEMWAERAGRARAGGMHAIAEGSVARWFTPAWRTAHPEITSRMRDLTADTPADGYAGACAALTELDLVAELPGITAPTLVLSTAQDPAFPPEHGRLIAERIPDARFEIVDSAAHLGTVEQPATFLRLITEHLRRTS
ncbi:3-carboxy-cis,cis-muconate cycloisomerase [Nocardia australiensis]|uniref:3-carboxy-cis,cis-muconate cycloisomerase n=1 Tax=Nocardia australiensis TaxID=2887191 RepID=UPI001D159332|nr:3-carboxy-cis,cis-muconate cycloisomerase [Nocardia australiensis]